MIIFLHLAAIRCSDSPDLLSRGSSYSWTGSDVFSTNITYIACY